MPHAGPLPPLPVLVVVLVEPELDVTVVDVDVVVPPPPEPPPAPPLLPPLLPPHATSAATALTAAPHAKIFMMLNLQRYFCGRTESPRSPRRRGEKPLCRRAPATGREACA
jgi:hypothetical protein